MTRRESREQAFCLLFQNTIAGDCVDDVLSAAHEARDLVPTPFTEELCYGVEERLEELDSAIVRNLRGWKMHRLSKVALTLLRLAAFEVLFCKDTPDSVAINEAVELCKAYGGEKDPAYINGVLGSMARSKGQNVPRQEDKQDEVSGH